ETGFPPMMLQSLVENAIKHGLEPKLEGGQINIRARLADEALIVQVVDNGVGFSPRANDGVVLADIRERLNVLYGGKEQLLIEVPPHGGTCASIHVPYKIIRK